MTEQVIRVARDFYERISSADTSGAAALISPDYVGHGLGASGGPDAVKEDLETWLAAVPDLHIEVHDTIAQSDRVAVRTTMQGTQTGVFAGIPASGRTFAIGATDVLRVTDGSIVEAWTLCDLASMFAQVGALPDPSRSRQREGVR